MALAPPSSADPTAVLPSQVSGLLVWLDVSTASTVNAGNPQVGDAIATLADRSGNGNTATAAGSDAFLYEPATVAVSTSSLPIAYLNDNGTLAHGWFTLPLGAFKNVRSISILGVILPNSESTVVYAEWSGFLVPSISYNIGVAHDWVAGWAASIDGNGIALPADDVVMAPPAGSPNSNAVTCVVCDDGTNTGTVTTLGELLVYNRALHSSEVTQLRNYLSAKWDAM